MSVRSSPVLAPHAAIPITLILVPMVGCHWPASRAMPVAWPPHVLIAVLPVLSRIDSLPFKEWLTGISFTVPRILGHDTVSFSMKPLYLPGVMPRMFADNFR